MPTTVANRLALAKEVWDGDEMVKQFYDDYPFLKMIEQRQRVVIGKRAQVPVHLDRAGGAAVFTSAGATGVDSVTSIPVSGNEQVGQAQYNMAYNYFPVGFQVGAMNEITGGAQSVGDAMEHTISSGINNIRNHVLRQFLTGHGRIAQAANGANDNTVLLALPAGTNAGEVSGVHALQMGWVVDDDVVQVGTIADPDSLTGAATARTVLNTIESITAPTFDISGAAIDEDVTHFVRLGTNGVSVPTIESEGLITIAGTTGNTVGTISGVTEPRWNPSEVFTGSQLPDLELLLRLNRRVTKRTGKSDTFLLTGLEQIDNIYQFLQTQVRFGGDKELGAGASESIKWRGMTIHAFPHVPDNFLFFLDMQSLEIVVGKYSKPTWLSDIAGSGMDRNPRSTLYEDTVMYALGLAARRRNSMAAATNLVSTA